MGSLVVPAVTVLQMSGVLCAVFVIVGLGIAHLDRRDDDR